MSYVLPTDLWNIRSLEGKVLGNFQSSEDLSVPLSLDAQKILFEALKEQRPPLVKICKQKACYAYAKLVRNEAEETAKLETLDDVLRGKAPEYRSHVVQVYQSFNYVHPIIIMKAAQGIAVKNDGGQVVARITSLYELLSVPYITQIPLRFLLYVLVQLIVVFVKFQSILPGFAHNDMKLDNVLLEPLQRNEVLEYPEFGVRMPSCPFRIVLIDLETAVGGELPKSKFSIPKQVQDMFGFGDDVAFCEYTDFHLLMLLIVWQVKQAAPAWSITFLKFASSWPGMKSLFETHKEGNKMVTSMNRLTSSARSSLQTSIDSGVCPPLRSLLFHPIFDAVLDRTYDKSYE